MTINDFILEGLAKEHFIEPLWNKKEINFLLRKGTKGMGSHSRDQTGEKEGMPHAEPQSTQRGVGRDQD
jgi:hypothetical protein